MLRDPGNRRLAVLGAIAAIALVAILVLVLVGSNSSPSVAPALHKRKAPLISIFEADSQVDSQPLGALKLIRSLGADRVRVFIPWGEISGRPSITPDPTSPTEPAGFDAADPAAYPTAGWQTYDAIDRAAAQDHIGLYFELGPPGPLWAAGRGAPPKANKILWKPSAQQFGLFVRAIATRYSGQYTPPGESSALPRVNFWGIWNEPNYGVDLAPQAIDGGVEVSPMLYRGLADAAWKALQATGHGHDTILIGELAPRGVNTGLGISNGMVPLRFLRALYCVGSNFAPLRGPAATARGCPPTAAGSAGFEAANPALFHASGMSIHPYPQDESPNVPGPNPDYADLPVFPKLEKTLDSLVGVYGSRKRFLLYSTEYGYKTNPPYDAGVPVATAARYLNWGEYLSWRDSRVRSYDQYLLVDPPCLPAVSCFATGLEYVNDTPKPTLDAYRMPLYLPQTTFAHGHAVEVWGCVRPARSRHPRAEIQFAPKGSATFKTLREVRVSESFGYFDILQQLPGSGSVRTAWKPPGEPEIFSRTVIVSSS